MRPRKDFGSDMQYKKYLLAVEYGEKIQELMNKGYTIFDERNQVIEGSIIIPDDDDDDWCAVGIECGNSTLGLVCFSYGDDNVPWLEISLKEIHKIFRTYKCINPKYMYSIHIKNPKYKKK